MSSFYQLMMRKKEQIMYATIKGKLTENDGVFSGFSASNYLQLQNQFTLSPTTKAEFNFKINISSLTSNNAIFGSITNYGLYVGINSSGNLELFVGDNSSWVVTKTGTTTLSTSTDYDIKLNINNNVATLYIDGNIELTANLGLISSNTYDIGVGRGITTSDYFRGSVDLNNSYIKLGTKYKLQSVVGYTKVGSPTIVDGVVSGFALSNYITIPTDFNENNFEIVLKMKDIGANNLARTIMRLQNSDITIGLTGSNHLSVTGISNLSFSSGFNTSGILYVKLVQKGLNLYFGYSNDGITYTMLNKTLTEQISYVSPNRLFQSSNWNDIPIKWYAKDSYIKINNKLWFNGQEA